MASSSSCSRRYDVFPSFSGEDVRKSFLSHLLRGLDRKSINTFIDHGIERSRPIVPELLSAIRESRISIVVFSKNYASSTWCLNELVEIHTCYTELNQMVIPIFYNVDPSEVRKQTGEFGKIFEETCNGKAEDQKRRWMQALGEVSNMAGEDLRNWCNEADLIDKIADDVSVKLIPPSDNFGDFVGIEAHIEAMNSVLCLESEEARMVGIVGPSGIGKSTIARALFSQLSSRFHYQAFVAYRRTIRDDYGMKLCWEEQFLSEVLCQKDIKLVRLGAVEQRLKHKKVLIVLDDVDDIELLKTLVGQTGWFGSGSRIIVITQDKQLLKAHEIDLIYEVKFPSKDVALQMFCRSAFGKNYPARGLMELANEVVELSGKLPLGLSVLGSSLKGRAKDEWMDVLPDLQNGLDGKIEKILRVGYDKLHGEDQELFLYIAFICSFNNLQGDYIGFNWVKVSDIKDLLGDSVKNGLTMLAAKSLIRITPRGTVEMHTLLQKLGKEIIRSESINNPGKRRYLVDVEDIRDVLTDKIGTDTVLGIYFNALDIEEPVTIDEKSFQGMRNLQFLIVQGLDYHRWQTDEVRLHQGLSYLPRKLRLLEWNQYPFKCLPSDFKAECLVELRMVNSSLENLWKGTLPLRSLKKMDMSFSRYLKEIPDLSYAINLEELNLVACASLATLHSSLQNLIKLRKLDMTACTSLVSLPSIKNLIKLEWLSVYGCTNLEFFPTLPAIMEFLEVLNITECPRLRNFPMVSVYTAFPKWRNFPSRSLGIGMEFTDCLWLDNFPGFDYFGCVTRLVTCKVRPEHLAYFTMKSKTLKKLWEGAQSLGSLREMNLSGCQNLNEFPDLSMSPNIEYLRLNKCKSLVTVPSTIGNLNRLAQLEMKKCTMLEVLPTDVNLSCLETLNLDGCSRLRSFPQISRSIACLYLNDTAIEEVPCCIGTFSRLTELKMHGCKRLKNISPNIFRLTSLENVNFADCGEVTALNDAIAVETVSMDDQLPHIPLSPRPDGHFEFNNCLKLDGDGSVVIQRSYFRPTVLPGGEVPTYFTHRASRNYVTVTLPKRSISQVLFEFKACVVVEPLTNGETFDTFVRVSCHFKGLDYVDHIFAPKMDSCKEDHLVLGSFMFRPIGRPSKLDYNDVEFEFSFNQQRIKGCGVLFSRVLPAPDACAYEDRIFETESNQDSGEILNERSNKQMRMASAVWPNFTVDGIDGPISGTYVISRGSFSLCFP